MTDQPAARDATAADNAALLALTAACPMEGDIGLCMQRQPDFFALNRLEGSAWRVGVVDDAAGVPIGCIAVADRRVYLHSEPARSMYVSDLKVHPAHRGKGVADALVDYARAVCLEVGGPDTPTFLTVLAGNRAVERWVSGGRGPVRVDRLGTIRAHSVSLLWRRGLGRGDAPRVARATDADLEEMAELWQRVAPDRQFAPVYDAGSFAAWIKAAPGLSTSDYWLARDVSGRLVGFVGMWDQSSFKQMQVTSYSRALGVFRAGFNAIAPAFRAAPLPKRGGFIRSLNAVNVCVPPDRADALRALLLTAYNDSRGQGYSFFNVGLAVDDPLTAALSGLLAQHTDIWGCVTAPGGAYTGPPLAGRPLHHEIALV